MYQWGLVVQSRQASYFLLITKLPVSTTLSVFYTWNMKKTCSTCHQLNTKCCFHKKQWKTSDKERPCKDCVADKRRQHHECIRIRERHHNQHIRILESVLLEFCSKCHHLRKRYKFRTSQWKESKEERLCKNCFADNRRQLNESICVRIASATFCSPFYNYSLSNAQWPWDMCDTQDKSLRCPPEPPVM